MRLQIKDAGSWRNVVSFEEAQRETVMAAGAALLATQPEKVSMRVVDGAVTLYHCSAPTCLWSLHETH